MFLKVNTLLPYSRGALTIFLKVNGYDQPYRRDALTLIGTVNTV